MADQRKWAICFTSDTHGYLLPTNYADAKPRPMGLCSLCEDFRKDGNTLVLDGGDTLQGSPLAYYCHLNHIPFPAAEVIRRAGYDYVTLGNHDFNYGPRVLGDYLNRCGAACLCANVETDLFPVRPYAIHTLANGLRIGVVGLVTPWVNRWENPAHLRGIRIGDPLAAARKACQALTGRVDWLVGVYHGGLEKDLQTGKPLTDTDENIGCRLCEELPFDMLLTGHQHMPLAGQYYAGTYVAQTPANALAYIRLEAEGRTITSRLVPARAETSWWALAEAAEQGAQQWLDEPIGRLDRPLPPGEKIDMALQGSLIANFFNQVQLWHTGADISCTSLGNEVKGFNQAVTVRDVVGTYIYPNTLLKLQITGGVLRQALERCAAYFTLEKGVPAVSEAFLRPKEEHYNYDFYAGLTYAFDISRPVGQRVTELRFHGAPVAMDQRLSLCLNNYRATGTGGYEMLTGCPVLATYPTEMSELILNYLRERDLTPVETEHCYTVTW